MNLWEKYFSEVFESQKERTQKYQWKAQQSIYDEIYTEDLDREIDMAKLENEIRNLKNNKTPGEDNIINEYIKNNPQKYIENILNLLNMCWRRREICAS